MKLSIAAISLLALSIYLWGANRQSTLVNIDMKSTDQSAYMQYAIGMADTNWQYIGDRNRMPVYPALMSLFYRHGMTQEDFFRRGKTAGIVIGLMVLAIAYVVLRRGATARDASTATAVAAFTVFAYKSPYFQAEVLFYAISLTLFYVLLSLLANPKLTTATFSGLVGGLGHLTKASVLPAIVLAALLLVARGAVDFHRWRRLGRPPSSSRWHDARQALQPLVCASVLLVSFLLLVYPYISTSERVFGHYFYNVNSTFYVWYDSWSEVKRGTRAHGDRTGWPDMAEDELPSFRKYVREHSLGQIAGRFTRGFDRLRKEIARSYGYAGFLVLYLIALALLYGQNPGLRRSLLSSAHPACVLFVVGYFLGYLALYAWYTPIARGNRLVLSLFLPAMFVFARGLSHADAQEATFHLLGKKINASTVSPVVLLFLTAYILSVFPYRVSSMYGGS